VKRLVSSKSVIAEPSVFLRYQF